jgi:glycosyltransferase involved in cell wall biosynthesis
MNIVHLSMFAPNRCGLYEASRDMARADIEAGHQVYFVDCGVRKNDGTFEQGLIGAVDDRAGFRLETCHPDLIDMGDIIIMHTCPISDWMVRNQAPIILVLHGRPRACYNPEIFGKRNSLSLYKTISNWKRTKKALFFWEEFIQYWENLLPNEKIACLDYPVIDQNRFKREGPKHTLINQGAHNFLICDSEREDIDLFELINNCIVAAKKIPGVKFHFYGVDMPLKDSQKFLFEELKRVGGLGDLQGRVSNMELVYRSVDAVISPNRIITRTIAESLSCGTPVITELGCKVSSGQCYFPNTESLTITLEKFISRQKEDTTKKAENFRMDNYSKKMELIYNEVLK